MPRPDTDRHPCYVVRVRGRLGPHWSTWLGMDVDPRDDGTTVLRGPLVDQAALHGLLTKLRDVGVGVVALAEIAPDAPTPEERQLPDQEGA